MEQIDGQVMVGYPLNGTVSGNLYLTDGAFGKALHLTGVVLGVDFDLIAHGCLIDPGLCFHGHTLSMWLKLYDLLSTSTNFLRIGFENNRVGTKWMHKQNGTLALRTQAAGSSQLKKVEVENLPLEKWFHICVTYNVMLDPTVYVNGLVYQSEISSPSVGAPNGKYKPFRIGPISDNYINIFVDEFHFWERLLQPEEVSLVYTLEGII